MVASSGSMFEKKTLDIVEYFGSHVRGNLIAAGNYLLYSNDEGVVDSVLIDNKEHFDKEGDGPFGNLNYYGDTFYFSPRTWDGLYRKAPADSVPQAVVAFGVAAPYKISRVEIMNDPITSKTRDLATIYANSKAGELTELDSFNAITTGSVPKGPLTIFSNKLFGVTRAGGSLGSGVLFEYDPQANTFTKLFDFPARKSGYSGGVSSSLIVVEE